MARFTSYFGKPIYQVTFARTDEPETDTLCVAAWSRQEAIDFTHRMYQGRVRSILRATRERR